MVKKKRFKGLDETKVLYMVFILLAILVIGTLFVANPKFTGMFVFEGEDYDTLEECGAAGYNWEEITNETCDTITNCVTETIDIEPCLGYEDVNGTQGDCITWTSYENETCTDSQNCTQVVIGGKCVGALCGDGIVEGDEVCDDGTNDNSYGTCSADCLAMGPYCGDSNTNGEEECDDGDNNGEYDYCLADCSGDGAFCGDEACDAEEDCSSCESDCGTCDTSSDENVVSSDDIMNERASSTGNVVSSICVPNWECGGWSECVEGSQSRDCSDTNVCGVEEGKPAISQSCEAPETCSDEIKNQDERGIDCGGVCEERCGFFTIMGNAVNVPLNSSKQFIEENKALSFSILGVVVLIVSWLLVAKFVLKKSAFFFLKDVNFLKGKKKASSE